MADLLRALEACQAQERREELKAEDSEKRERELEAERQLQAQVQESREHAAQAGAVEWAAALFRQGLAREESARISLREHDFTAAQQAHQEAIAFFDQARKEAQKVGSLRKAERIRQEMAATKAEAERYGARERARSFYRRGLSVEAQAEGLWGQQSYTQAAQVYSEAIRFFADARELAYRETLREETEVTRTEAATAGQQSEDAWTQGEQAGQIYDHARVEAESSPKALPSPLRQTTEQSVMGRWVGRAAMLLGTVAVSATVIWFVALRQESPLNIPAPGVKVPPPPTTTPVSSTPKPTPPELPPLSPPVPEEKPFPSMVTRPDVTESLRLGQFFQDRGQYDEAIRELEEAKGRAPDNTDIITALKRVRSAKEAEDRLNRSP
jgi:tetratricopeptide (TPR) repeat protein